MEHRAPSKSERFVRLATILIFTALSGGYPLLAAQTESSAPAVDTAQTAPADTASEELPNSNWMNLSLGGLIPHGNMAQFRQNNPTLGPVYGGIQDMHLEQQVFNDSATLKLDAEAMFYNNMYNIQLELTKEDLGYIKGGWTQYTTYYNGNGGFLPATYERGAYPSSYTATNNFNGTIPNGLFAPGPQWALNRGSLWFEAGLRIPNVPQVTFRYEYAYRQGQKDSTAWGSASTGTTPAGNPYNVGTTGVNGINNRKILPAFYDIDERRNILTLDVKHTLGKPETYGNTDVNLGLLAEFDTINDSLNTQNQPGAPATPRTNNINNVPLSANGYYTTQQNSITSSTYGGRLSTVTRFGEKLWLTLGASYYAVASGIGGNRIMAPYWGAAYSPYYNNVAYARTGYYTGLGGGSTANQTVAALNILWNPIKDLTITPSFRIGYTDTRSSSHYLGQVPQVTAGSPAQVVTNAGSAGGLTRLNSHVTLVDYTESLVAEYKGIRDVVLYAQGDWDQPCENRGYYSSPSSVGTAQNFGGDNTAFIQKYTVGANWYPLSRLNAAIQAYYLNQNINQSINQDISNDQRLLDQNWTTYDGNVRVTWKPLPTVSLVSRYDVQQTTINSKYAAWSLGETEFTAPYGLSSVMNTQMFTESATWYPWDRLYFQGTLSYVLNEISSPSAAVTQAAGNSQNNYMMASAGFGLAIDPKTQFRGDFTYYAANDYYPNVEYAGVPYGAGATQYTLNFTLSRQINRNVSVSMQYFIDSYADRLSGGNNSYLAQMLAAGVQIGF